ncbi:hypothetical protein VI08_06080 [Luteibacter yeojuensis]|uniref:Molybdopterin synthase sulfur carrier subunit n=1 Tax=Luteibacter yeojuensis TaxID=345309 RepID=A0A0F3L1E0_9GAMM|nr:hypothetical protein VI08_06080 [Luteibacter yeojuensis]
MARLAGAREVRLDAGTGIVTVADAVALLARAKPELAASLDRCACVAGDTIVRRADAMPADGRLALLPPVAGG